MAQQLRWKKEVPFYMLVVMLFLLGTIMGSRSIETIAEKIPMERLHRIVIDPGHGGEDGGAVSCTGKNESNFNLQISLRLNDLFHLLGYETVMIRTTDVSVYTSGDTIAQRKVSDLKQRVRIVQRTSDAVLVSIHQNTFPEGKYSGAQVFYAASHGSKELSARIQADLVASLNPGSSRKEKKGEGIYLLEKITTPGVLVECGFLSNSDEAQLLRQPEQQKRLVAAIVAGYLNFGNH